MSPAEERRIRAILSGRVQGVFYRASARDKARELGLAGWVRNLADGRVELLAQGPSDEVERLLDWCREGPPGARVDGLEATEEEPQAGLSGFRVRVA